MPPKGAGEDGPSTTTESGSVGQARALLERNNVFINNRDAKERGLELITKAKLIARGGRKSILSLEDAEKLCDLADRHRTDNELTFLVNVWGVLLKEERWAKADDTIDDETKVEWIQRAFEKDGLKCNWQQPFATDCIPPLKFSNDTQEKLAQDIPKLANPVPDLAYGFTKQAFTVEQQMVNDSSKAAISGNEYHTTLAVEAQGSRLPIEEAINPCARAGTAMVTLKRKFDKFAEATNVVDEDKAKGTGSGAQLTGSTADEADKNAEEADESEKEIVEIANEVAKITEGLKVSEVRQDVEELKSVFKNDEDSFCYTLAIDPRQAELFVMWAEEEIPSGSKKALLRHHMHTVEAFYLHQKPQGWSDLHSRLDNVLDWICGKRKRGLAGLCDKIAANSKGSNKRPRR